MAEHSEVIDTAIRDIIQSSDELTKALENRIAEAILASGAQPDRQTIRGIYNQYAQAARSAVDPMRSVSADTVENQTRAGIAGSTPEDAGVESLLLDDAASSLSETVTAHGESITNLVVTSAVTGAAVATVAQAARGQISGVFMETDDPVTGRLQSELRALTLDPGADPKQVAELRKRIRDRLPVPVAGSLADALRGSAENTVMRFDGAFTANRAKRAGITRYRYEGGVIDTSRPWCADLAGQTLDEASMNDLWTESWAGKSGDNPFVDRGGYNCRHYWVPVEEE